MSELRSVPYLSSGLDVEARLLRIASRAALLWNVPDGLDPESRSGRAFWAAVERSGKVGGHEGEWLFVSAAAGVITRCGAHDRASVALRGVYTAKQALDAGADPMVVEIGVSLGVAISDAVHWPDHMDTEAAFSEVRQRLRDDRADRARGGPKAAVIRVGKWHPWAADERKAYLGRHPGRNKSYVARHLADCMEKDKDAGLVSTVVGFDTLYRWARRQKD